MVASLGTIAEVVHHGDRTAVASPRVMAHYVPSFPVSIDNAEPSRDYYATQFLRPAGEGGKHAAVGGYTRDRPTPVNPKGSSWREDNASLEIATAVDYGIDGFYLDVPALSGSSWDQAQALLAAASKHSDFHVIPLVDLDGIGSTAPSVVASAIARLLAGTPKLDGAMHVGAFRPEAHPVRWWEQFLAALRSAANGAIRFHAVLLDPSNANVSAFASCADYLGDWGPRSPEQITASATTHGRVSQHGLGWIATVALQDYRPKDRRYLESKNTTTYRMSWEAALPLGPAFVQIATWNDYSETSAIADSIRHGTTFLDLTRHYAHQAKHRDAPLEFAIGTTRVQFAHAKATNKGSVCEPTIGGYTTVAIDQREVVVCRNTPSTLEWRSQGGSRSTRLPAGLHSATYELTDEPVTATITSSTGTVMLSFPPGARRVDIADYQYRGLSARSA